MLKNFVSALLLSATLLTPFSTSQLNGEIIEIESIASLQDYTEEDGLALLNVGETLFSPSCMLADNQWRLYFAERVKELISEQEIAQAIIDEVKGLVVEMVPKIAPETITPSIIENLQKKKIPVLGYTQRQMATTYAPKNGLIVSGHLLSIGIDLTKSLDYFDAVPYGNQKHDFQYGIIFTNKHPVGPAVAEFLQDITQPSKVVMVDDNLEVLKEIEAVLESLHIPYFGLRYARTDAHKAAFKSDVANIQFLSFARENRLLSDVEALDILLETSQVDYQGMLDNWISLRAQQLAKKQSRI